MSGPNEHMQTYVVGGTSQKVRRSRVVWMISDFSVAEMSCACGFSFQSFAPVGVAQPWTRNPAGTPFDTSLEAGLSGDEIMVYTNGAIAYAQCGGTIAAGQAVAPHTDGTIIAAVSNSITGDYWRIGVAKEAGAAGDVIRIDVNIFA